MKVFIDTIGCKLNQFESQALAEGLEKKDYKISQTLEDSDFVIINTCSVTNKADVKSRQAMRRAKKLGKRVIATGCYATTDYNTIDGADFADMVVKNDSKFLIPELIEARLSMEDKIPALSRNSEFPVVHQFERTRAFIKIQDGCDKFCSYCKIPHARGRSRSLNPETAVQFAENLIQSGYKEIVLTGINISDYHYNDYNLTSLIGDILKLDGDFRIRLSSLQPDEFDRRMLDFLKHPKFTGHFHLSLQSGSTGVLERMERNYTSGYFMELCRDIRKDCPDCGITTDIIVGFPGETDAEFGETLDLVEKVSFTRVHIFPYSHRSHTKASKLPDIDGKVKKSRIKILEEKSNCIALNFAQKNVIGKSYRVLTEAKEESLWTGYTPNYFKVYFDGIYSENEFVNITVKKAEVHKHIVELRVE